MRRRRGDSARTYYRLKAQYGGLQVNETGRLKALEEENRRLEKIVANQTDIVGPEHDAWRESESDPLDECQG